MAATVRGVAGYANDPGLSVSFGENDASPQAGDTRFLINCNGAAATPSLPAGWTTLYSANVGSGIVLVAHKPWVAGVGTESITYSTGTYASYELVSVTGFDTGLTPQVATNGSATAGSTLTSASLTPATSNSLLLVFFAVTISSGVNATTTSLTTPAGLTLVEARSPTTSIGYPVLVGSKVLTSTAATGTFTSTVTPSGSGTWRSATVVIPSSTQAATAHAGQWFPFLGLGAGFGR